jgi:hypothetical protein
VRQGLPTTPPEFASAGTSPAVAPIAREPESGPVEIVDLDDDVGLIVSEDVDEAAPAEPHQAPDSYAVDAAAAPSPDEYTDSRHAAVGEETEQTVASPEDEDTGVHDSDAYPDREVATVVSGEIGGDDFAPAPLPAPPDFADEDSDPYR